MASEEDTDVTWTITVKKVGEEVSITNFIDGALGKEDMFVLANAMHDTTCEMVKEYMVENGHQSRGESTTKRGDDIYGSDPDSSSLLDDEEEN